MIRALSIAVILTGCGGDDGKDNGKNPTTDTNPTGTVPATGPAQIDAVPRLLDFIPGDLGETREDFFTVLNNGGEKLTISGLTFTGDAFALIDDWDETFELDPGSVKYVDIEFTVGGLEDIGTVVIHSDDPVSPDLTVDLIGHGLVPQLTITPDIFDLGEIEVPCHGEVEIFLENTGTKDLDITSYDFVGSTPDIMLDALSMIPQPTVLTPGDSVSMIVDYLPETDDPGATGTLTVQSTDPAGDRVAVVTGSSAYADTSTDIFTVPDVPMVDVLFLIDNSCSMEGDNTADVNTGIPLLISSLGNVSNWQMIQVTHQNGCSNTPILDASVLDAETQLINGAFSTPNNFSEWLLETASLALSKSALGNCNAGFLRPGALLHILVASDENEQSGFNWSSWVSDFQTYTVRPDMVTVSSVVDINYACGDGSGPGGYLEAANDTNGALLDICTPYWGSQLTNIADSVDDAPPTYSIPPTAVMASLVVTLDGNVTIDYLYNPTLGILTLTDPAYVKDVSVVEVEYALASDCIP